MTAPSLDAIVQLEDLEQVAFDAAIVRLNRAAFEFRSSEAAFDRLCKAYVRKRGGDPEALTVSPQEAGFGEGRLIPRPSREDSAAEAILAAGEVAAAGALADPPPASRVPPPGSQALAAGTEMVDPEPIPHPGPAARQAGNSS